MILIWKQNQDCSEKLMANGDSFVWSRIWGQEVAGNVMHLPSPHAVAARCGFGLGTKKPGAFHLETYVLDFLGQY